MPYARTWVYSTLSVSMPLYAWYHKTDRPHWVLLICNWGSTVMVAAHAIIQNQRISVWGLGGSSRPDVPVQHRTPPLKHLTESSCSESKMLFDVLKHWFLNQIIRVHIRNVHLCCSVSVFLIGLRSTRRRWKKKRAGGQWVVSNGCRPNHHSPHTCSLWLCLNHLQIKPGNDDGLNTIWNLPLWENACSLL